MPALALTGCFNNPVSRHYEWQKHAELVEFAPEPLYCYRTLAQVDCYTRPLDRRESNRIQNYYGPPPGRVVMVVTPPMPQEKVGNVIDYPPLMVPREKVESEPLQPAPQAQPKPPSVTGSN
ncbi:MAG: hypothetical protein FJX60_13060 [Alphaproteobacteria bacterium]|nr:hypothetical protein [Alphaproteobacteria bacterium]